MKVCTGNDNGVARDENHIVVETEEPRVVFSFCRKGNAVSAHFAADGVNKNGIKKAINEFCEWVFESMSWCEMILGIVCKRSIGHLIEQCGFEKLKSGTVKGQAATVYMRVRS